MAKEKSSDKSPPKMMMNGRFSGAAPPSLLGCGTLSQTALARGTVPLDAEDVSGSKAELCCDRSCAVTMDMLESLWTGSCMKYMCLWTGEEPVETKGQCSTSGMCKVPWQQDKTVESLAEVTGLLSWCLPPTMENSTE